MVLHQSLQPATLLRWKLLRTDLEPVPTDWQLEPLVLEHTDLEPGLQHRLRVRRFLLGLGLLLLVEPLLASLPLVVERRLLRLEPVLVSPVLHADLVDARDLVQPAGLRNDLRHYLPIRAHR